MKYASKHKRVIFLKSEKFYALNRFQIAALIEKGIPGEWVKNERYPDKMAYSVDITPEVVDILNSISNVNSYVIVK